jgi:murein DD-endopeptidase MepM/ murein hydrolase activator NlpD
LAPPPVSDRNGRQHIDRRISRTHGDLSSFTGVSDNEAGARLAVVEFSSMRSPASVYWDVLPDELYPEDIEAGWVSVRAFLGNMLFGTPSSDAIHSYYALVALGDRASSRARSAATMRPQAAQAPFLLGPNETYAIDVTVELPEAERSFLPNLVNPVDKRATLVTTPRCNTEEAKKAGVDDNGCANDEVGFRGWLDDGTRRRNPHMGMDLRARLGTDIKPVADGTVVYADYVSNPNQVYGCTVIVRHDNGYESLYAHLDGPKLPGGGYDCQLDVAVGDRVTAGETRLGGSGGTNELGATAPYEAHLHLSLSPSGFDFYAPNTSMVISTRGVCDQRNNVPNGVVHLTAHLVLSYPQGNTRVKESLVSDRFTGNARGIGECVNTQLTLSDKLTRAALLSKIGADRTRTLAYLAIEYSWDGLHQPGAGAIVGPKTEVDPERPFMDSVTAVGVTSVVPEVVRLDETALVEGYGFGANQLQGTAEMNVYYHAASRSGPSASPSLEAQIVGADTTTLITDVPGPSAIVDENAAWGTVAVRFANGRNSTYEEASNNIRVAPVIENARVGDGVRTGFARGGMTLAVAGHGLLSGPSGEASFATDLTTHPHQGELRVEPGNLTPLGFDVTVPDELYSGPAVIGASVDSLRDENDESITIYPYITSSPRTGASGQTATITGTGLGPDVAVHFNGADLQAPGNGTAVSFTVGDHVRSGALSVTAAGQQSGNGVRFVAFPTLTIDVVDAETGDDIHAALDYIAVNLDDPEQGAYDEGVFTMGGELTAQRTDRLFGSGVWRFEASADGYDPGGSSERMYTTTPDEVVIALQRIPEPEPEQ